MTPCEKVSYRTKSAARRARRKIPRLVASGTLRPYYCAEHEAWHLGNLALAVRRGEASRGEVYGGAS